MTLKLNLGSGNKPKAGFVNLDRVDPGYDTSVTFIEHDVDVFPWPFRDGGVAEIEAHHLFEHVSDPLGFMEECWRVLEVGGTLYIEVPYYTSRNAFTDPTHKRYCTEETWDYWVRSSWLWDMGGVGYHRNSPFEHVRPPAFGLDLSVLMRKVAR